jgi:maltooligosyltrehalose trehalohydrolase
LTRRFVHEMPFGAAVLPGGGTRFRLWAPGCARVVLETNVAADVDRRNAAASGPQPAPRMQPTAAQLEMTAMDGGWHELVVADAGGGSRYRFEVQTQDGGRLAVPDPASRHNPGGVHEASAVIDPLAYSWTHGEWRGRPWKDAVVYELHVGTFTAQGTYAAARARLPELAELGITVLQLMPLSAFPGRRGWGYDGVLPYAPAACYGEPDELKAFIDAAHALGLMVMLDVVYNHFGPEGNYLHAYCPQFFNPAHRTPWGAAINFDGENSATVREFFVHNALYWVEEYRFDGLRLDAVHAMRDDSSPDIVCSIARALHEGPGRERQVHVVLENHNNESRYLQRGRGGAPLYATAQWDDDVHHALHVITTGERDGYYADFAANPIDGLGRALTEGFAYQGEYSAYHGAPAGAPSTALPPGAFVGFLQNHDMVGNRACGERIHSFADAGLLAAAYVCLLLTPEVPMLFMGEEFAASTPFLYFCDFGGELAKAVSEGRRREFQRFAAYADEAARARIPDPNAASTFAASKLRWEERGRPPHGERLALVRELLALRRRHLWPHLGSFTHGGVYDVQGALLRAEWQAAGVSWHLLANFGAQAVPISRPAGETVYATQRQHGAADGQLGAGGALVILGAPSRAIGGRIRADA